MIWFRQLRPSEHGFSNAPHYSEHFLKLELFPVSAVAWTATMAARQLLESIAEMRLHRAGSDLESL
jgi:hypothetical protein